MEQKVKSIIKSIKKTKIKIGKPVREGSKESQRSVKSIKGHKGPDDVVNRKMKNVKSVRHNDQDQIKKSQLINQLLFKQQQQRLNSVKNNQHNALTSLGIHIEETPQTLAMTPLVPSSSSEPPSSQLQPNQIVQQNLHQKLAESKLLIAIHHQQQTQQIQQSHPTSQKQAAGMSRQLSQGSHQSVVEAVPQHQDQLKVLSRNNSSGKKIIQLKSS